MQIWLLIQDFDYEGYGQPTAAWVARPTQEQLVNVFVELGHAVLHAEKLSKQLKNSLVCSFNHSTYDLFSMETSENKGDWKNE